MDPKELHIARRQAAASLAGGMIAAAGAGGRHWNIEEAMELLNSVQHAMFPAPGNGHFEEWAKTADLKKYW